MKNKAKKDKAIETEGLFAPSMFLILSYIIIRA